MAKQERLGDILLEAKLITESQLRTAIELQKSVRGKLGEILIKLGFVDEIVLDRFLAEQMGISLADLTSVRLDDVTMRMLPRDFIERHLLVPIRKRGSTLTLAMADPNDFDAISNVEFITGMRTDVLLASKSIIQRLVARYYAELAEAEATSGEGAEPAEDTAEAASEATGNPHAAPVPAPPATNHAEAMGNPTAAETEHENAATEAPHSGHAKDAPASSATEVPEDKQAPDAPSKQSLSTPNVPERSPAVSQAALNQALIALLIEKKIISRQELLDKAVRIEGLLSRRRKKQKSSGN